MGPKCLFYFIFLSFQKIKVNHFTNNTFRGLTIISLLKSRFNNLKHCIFNLIWSTINFSSLNPFLFYGSLILTSSYSGLLSHFLDIQTAFMYFVLRLWFNTSKISKLISKHDSLVVNSI